MRITTGRVVAAWFALGLVVVVTTLQLTGNAPTAAAPGIPDPGLAVGWVLPMARVTTNLAALSTIGFLLLVVVLLPSGAELEGLAVQAVRLASRSAVVWAIAGVVLLVTNVSDVFARPPSTLTPTLVWSFVVDSAPGKALALQILGAALVATLSYWTFSVRALAATLGLALASIAPVALAGHAASAGSHTLATVSMLTHLISVMLWVGGLFALSWLAIRRSKRLDEAIERYSAIALWCFVTVALSGLINAGIRLGSWSNLNSTYGYLLIAKVFLLVGLGIFGYLQRRRITSQSAGFKQLAIIETSIMMVAIAFGVVLSRTPTPLGDDVLLTPAERLIGGPLPPAPDFWGLIFGWSANGLGISGTSFGIALYAAGVIALRRRGDHWPVGRTISWGFGLLIFAWATIGGLGEYSHVLFSAHMGSHMALSMVAPIFLVLGAPVTLALRALPGPRRPGENSPRSLLLALVHSRVARFYTHPVVAATIFVGSLYALYFSSLFATLMMSHSGHLVMELHFLLSGILFYYVVIGVDPAPRQPHALVRFGLLMVTLPFHAFFSVILMSATEVIAEEYYTLLDRPYAQDLLRDQYVGGGIAWGMGEVPLLLVMAAIFVQWIRSDAREAKRTDRAADRDSDAALEKYNAYLKSMQQDSEHR